MGRVRGRNSIIKEVFELEKGNPGPISPAGSKSNSPLKSVPSNGPAAPKLTRTLSSISRSLSLRRSRNSKIRKKLEKEIEERLRSELDALDALSSGAEGSPCEGPPCEGSPCEGPPREGPTPLKDPRAPETPETPQMGSPKDASPCSPTSPLGDTSPVSSVLSEPGDLCFTGGETQEEKGNSFMHHLIRALIFVTKSCIIVFMKTT